ncbi:DNA translocase FtsK [Phormidium tenue FACHB-886]|nr:DNA translocase FtsK [Phormidium tenue FACHB-886]
MNKQQLQQFALSALQSKSFWFWLSTVAAATLAVAPVAGKWNRQHTELGFAGSAIALTTMALTQDHVKRQVSLVKVRNRMDHQFDVDEMVHMVNRVRAIQQADLQRLMGASNTQDFVNQMMAAGQQQFVLNEAGAAALPAQTVTPLMEALAQYGVFAREVEQKKSPYYTRHVLELIPDEKGKVGKVKDVEGLSREVQMLLKTVAEPIVSVSQSGLLVDIPLPEDQRKPIVAETLLGGYGDCSHTDDCVLSLGVNVEGKLTVLNLSDPSTPAALVGGSTGSGKTEFLKTLLLSAVLWYPPEVLALAIADPKRVSFNQFADYAGMVAPIAKTPDDTALLVSTLVGEMQRRYELFEAAEVSDIKQYNANGGQLARILFLIDEYAELGEQCDDEQFKAIESGLKRLTQKARAAGIHLVLATQKPIAKSPQQPRGLDTVLRSNLPVSIALKVRNSSDSGVVLGEPGAEKLLGKGDMFANLGSQPERMQAPLISGQTTIKEAIARRGTSTPTVISQPTDPRQSLENLLKLDADSPFESTDLDSFDGISDEMLEAIVKDESVGESVLSKAAQAILDKYVEKGSYGEWIDARWVQRNVRAKAVQGLSAEQIRLTFLELSRSKKGEIDDPENPEMWYFDPQA